VCNLYILCISPVWVPSTVFPCLHQKSWYAWTGQGSVFFMFASYFSGSLTMGFFPSMGRLTWRLSMQVFYLQSVEVYVFEHTGAWLFQVLAKKIKDGVIDLPHQLKKLFWLTVKMCSIEIIGQMCILLIFILYVWHPLNIVKKSIYCKHCLQMGKILYYDKHLFCTEWCSNFAAAEVW
jgi:hypothetical protein